MAYYVYVLQSQSNFSFYKGSTEDIFRRVDEHNCGNVTFSAKYRPWNLVWYTSKNTRSEAVALEMKLKNLSTERLKEFIKKYRVPSEGRLTISEVID